MSWWLFRMSHAYTTRRCTLFLIKIIHSLLEGRGRYETWANFGLEYVILSKVYMPVLPCVILVEGCVVLYLHKNKFIWNLIFFNYSTIVNCLTIEDCLVKPKINARLYRLSIQLGHLILNWNVFWCRTRYCCCTTLTNRCCCRWSIRWLMIYVIICLCVLCRSHTFFYHVEIYGISCDFFTTFVQLIRCSKYPNLLVLTINRIKNHRISRRVTNWILLNWLILACFLFTRFYFDFEVSGQLRFIIEVSCNVAFCYCLRCLKVRLFFKVLSVSRLGLRRSINLLRLRSSYTFD